MTNADSASFSISTPSDRDGHLASGMEAGARQSLDRLADVVAEKKEAA